MKSSKIALVFYILFFCACKQHLDHHSVDNKSYKFASKFTLVSNSKVSFLLDSLTNPNIGNVQLFKSESITYLTFLNKQLNSIYFYDFKTTKFKFKIDVRTSGDDSVGPIVNSYFIKSMDSIYILSRYVINIIDRNAHLVSRINFQKNPPEGLSSLPQIYCYSPLVQQGEELLINTIPDIVASKTSNFNDKEILLRYNLRTASGIYEYKYPDIYRDGVFGPNYMYVYTAYNPNIKKIIFSFPADNNIYLSGADTLVSHYAGSKFLNAVKPMQHVRNDFEGYNKFYLKNPSYGPIYYDKFNDVYYRFALKPISEKAYAKRQWWKEKSIIVLDKKFSKVGEIALPDSVSFLDCFFTKDGLYANIDDKEDRVSFALFKLVKINSYL